MFIIDAQLSPHLAKWMNKEFNVEVYSLAFYQMQFLDDFSIFNNAKEVKATVIKKDSDFIKLQEKFGSLSKIIWSTCGNTSNKKRKEILKSKFSIILEF